MCVGSCDDLRPPGRRPKLRDGGFDLARMPYAATKDAEERNCRYSSAALDCDPLKTLVCPSGNNPYLESFQRKALDCSRPQLNAPETS